MIFEDRREAGKMLARKLVKYKNQHPLILALPRGGVPVGFEISKHLNASMDILVVRKLGAPNNKEFGIGAIAPGILVLDQTEIKEHGLTQVQLEEITQQEQQELKRRSKEYRGNKPEPDLHQKVVIVVDDGLATGMTMRAAIKSVLSQNPAKLIASVPVCARDSALAINALLRSTQDELVCLISPYPVLSISQWYKDFPQVTDQEVVNLLKEANQSKEIIQDIHHAEPDRKELLKAR